MRKPSTWKLWTLNFELLLSVMSEVEPRVRAFGMEMKELFLLGKLDEHPNPAALARALITPKPSVTFMVKRMEAAGFIRREMQPDDLRRFRLTLTPAGRKAMEGARAVLEQTFECRLSRLTPTARSAYGTALERMA